MQAFGGYRPGSTPTQTITDRDFTGQKENMELGLLYYNARFYVPGIGRFASADTLVPDPTNPQSYNRYSYVENRPLVAVDPTGHWLESAWDALNVGIGIASFVDNVKQGNYGWAAVDALGVVVDAAALVTPIVPGGVGAIIKGTRTVDTAVDAIQTVNQVSNAAQATNQAANAVQNADTARKINNRIVIGEGMEAVKAAAHKHGAKWYQAWSKNFLPENFDLDKSLARNERWIREKIQQGYEILDIGIDPIRSNRSPFYELAVCRRNEFLRT
ncbi:RHS repeat-associated core domain-containing protein [Arthrospira platensis SPKY1]|nr:RHS repeat-associated core domain-containing protein [Arthrospira platensis SPKY1]